ncbi:MAG: hypothetical protein ACRDSN_03025, partial [Pseudonocardiaceae bacterium]
MSFPPRDIVTELFVNGTWTDVSGDRRVADPVMIERGRKNEGSKPEPSVCSLTLDNRHGHYSPRNPIGPYYGDIGRNTPLRVSVRAASDSFARTVVDGWGSADSGHAWTIDGVGGTVADSDWQVNGGVGTQSVPVAAALRESYLATTSLRLVDVLIDVTLPFSDVTGGSVEPANVMLRGQAPDDYYVVRVEITTAEAVTIGLQHFDGTVIAAQVTVAGLTHTSAQALRVRAQAEGHTLRAKVWAATGSEPYGWQVSAHTESITGAGWVGIRSGVSAGNTNAKPIVFAYDNFELRVPRFAGELSALPQRWDLSGNDAWVPVEAAGITQRLGQGVSPLHSTLYRGTSRLVVPPVAYWPCEDGEEATAISSALPGVGSMYVAGPTEFASYDDIPASEPLPIVGEAAWVGSIPFYTGTGKVQLRYLLHVPAAEIVDRGLISQMHVSGTTSHWEIKYRTGGALSLEAWTQDHQLLLDTGPIGFTTLDRNVMISLALEQDGPHIDWNLAVLEVGQTFGLFSAG